MSTVFPSWMNATPAIGAGVGAVAALGVVLGITYYFTPEFWEVGYAPDQPVYYDHQLHAGKLGIDCRYCHSNVEKSEHANVPDTATCMGCHSGDADEGGAGLLNFQLWEAHQKNADLKVLRANSASGNPTEWLRIHKLPDYASFPHSAHVNAGISCYSCHGRIDRMQVVRQEESLSMGWCLNCHRDPEPHLIDTDSIRVTDLGAVAAQLASDSQEESGARLAREKQLEPPQNCGACHY